MPIPEVLLEREAQFAAAFRPAALTGIRLDQEQVDRLTAEHTEGREASRQRVEAATGGEVKNPKSAVQVAPYLVSTGRYELPLSEKTGKPGAPKGVLEQYAYVGDQLAADILEYRRHDTALGLLLEPRRELITHGDGRVRTSILTLAANTGRTSSRNENLQQISRQGGMRACHLAEPGCLIVSADFSSVEIRVGAALSGDASMKALIEMGDRYPERKKEFDFHWRTAVTCYGPGATKENRYNCKRVNFCVPEDGTEILTRRGWLRHDQVKAGDQTIGYNFQTGLSEWTPVLGVEHFGEADVVQLGNKHKSWMPVVTPNHRWITERRAGKDRLRKREWAQTASLTTEHSVILAARADTRQTVPVTPAEAALIAWAYCDGHVQQSPLTGKTSQGADGRRRKLTVSVAQAKPAGVVQLERVLRECGARYTMDYVPAANERCLPQRSYRLKTEYARELWTRAGLGEADKSLPGFSLEPFVLGLGPAARDAFLGAVTAAEGWVDGRTGGTRIGQNEGPVCDAIILAATLNGWYVRQNRSRSERGNAVHVTMVLSEPRVTGQRRTTEPAGRERVWCVTTKLGSWMMRQHGQVMLTGNSKMYGSGKKSASEQVGIPLKEVSAAFDAFDAVAPDYGRWDAYMRESVRNGMRSFPAYSGREIWLTGPGKGEHAAGNAAIQGTAREFLVDAVEKWERGPWGGHVLVPVHDELICFDVPEDEAEAATAHLVSCMETELLGVRITAEANPPSPHWRDAS